MICDFCSSPHITHAFAAKDHVSLEVDGTKLASEGAWAACEECASLIQSNDRPGLLQRALKAYLEMHPGLGRIHRRQVEKTLRKIHRGFYAHRKPHENN